MNSQSYLRSRLIRAGFLFATSLLTISAIAHGQEAPRATHALTVRLPADISDSQQTPLVQTLPALAHRTGDTGRVSGGKQLQGISLAFARSAEQQQDLAQLLTQLYNRSSPQFHKWLSPDQFAARFGMSTQDIAAASLWLERQGFSVDRVSRSRNRIFFSGSAAQVEAAFHTEMHTYRVDGEVRFGPSTALSLPSELAGVVENVGNLSNFRPVKQLIHNTRTKVSPLFTSGLSGSHFIAPGDLQTIYDVSPIYAQGITGEGQAIGILGQSSINPADIEAFQTAAGGGIHDPTLVLVPLSGFETFPIGGDESEADLDLEWSSTMAPGASIYYVYTGTNETYNVFSTIEYAVDTDLAPILNLSYGLCEQLWSPAEIQSIESVSQQAAAQGQTLIAASGDSGASTCARYIGEGLTLQQGSQLAVSYPASSQWWLSVGGTEFNEQGGNYWQSNGSQDVISSALSYIPERVWNDDALLQQEGYPNPIASGGGGASILFQQPAWQTGVPGIPTNGWRNLPDIALDAALGNDPFLFCTEDPTAWQFTSLTSQESSCTAGFRDSYTNDLTSAGGTSFAAPIFSGMLALINQSHGSTGQGVVASTLYQIASNSTAYASAFHDITVGDNSCDSGSVVTCPNGATGYSAGVGYDQATGLGSVDLLNLIQAWPASNLQTSYIKTDASYGGAPATVVPQNTPVQLRSSAHFQSGDGRPMTGTVTYSIDGKLATTTPIPLQSGTASFTASFTGNGTHVILTQYSGDSYYSPAEDTVILTAEFGTATVVTASSLNPVVGAPETFNIIVEPSTINPNTGSSYVGGLVSILIDGQPVGPNPAFYADIAQFGPYTFATPGIHTVEADYTGDGTFSASKGVATVNVATQSVATTTSVTAATVAPFANVNDLFTITVKPATGTSTPAGNVTVLVDGKQLPATPALGPNGVASLTIPFASGTHTVLATYVPQGAFLVSTGTLTVTAPALATTTTTMSPLSATTTIGGTETFTVTVSPPAGMPAPTGTIFVTVDNRLVTLASPVALNNGAATFAYTFTTPGTHAVEAVYSGDATFGTSSGGSASVTVIAGGFALAANDLEIQQGGSGESMVLITPGNAYKGTIAFKVVPSGNAPSDVCFSLPNATVSGSGTVNAMLSISTNEVSCTTASLRSGQTLPNHGERDTESWPGSAVAALAGLVILGSLRRRSRGIWTLLAVTVLAVCGLAVTGCSGQKSIGASIQGNSVQDGSGSSAPLTPRGSYHLKIIGTDTGSATVTSSTTLTLTIQ
jgi:subtilase family serine protease